MKTIKVTANGAGRQLLGLPPNLTIHHFPQLGKPRDVATPIMEAIIERSI